MPPILIQKEKDLANFLAGVFSSRRFHLVLVAAGIILRLKVFLENNALWLNEAITAVNITSRSYREILFNLPLMPNIVQTPLIFSLIEKMLSQLLGPNEFALRLFPCVSGIAALILFYGLIQRWLAKGTVTLALALVAFSPALIYYGAQVKPYTSDLLLTVILFWMLEAIRAVNLDWKKALRLGLTGAVALWISNTSVFVLGAIAIALAGKYIFEKQWRNVCFLILSGLLWLISFILLYKVVLSGMVADKVLSYNWHKFFMPRPGWSWESLRWGVSVTLEYFRNPLGLAFPVVMSGLFVTGCAVSIKKHPLHAFICAGPLVMAFLAACVRIYPFRERLLLFSVVGIYILLAEGTAFIIKKFRSGRVLAGVLIIGILLVQPITTCATGLFTSSLKEDNRIVLKYLKENFVAGDSLVMNNNAQFAYWFYACSLPLDYQTSQKITALYDGKMISGYPVGQFLDVLSFNPAGIAYTFFKYVVYVFDEHGRIRKVLNHPRITKEYPVLANSALELIGDKRVWVFFSNIPPEVKSFLLNILDKRARRLKTFERQGAALYLFEF